MSTIVAMRPSRAARLAQSESGVSDEAAAGRRAAMAIEADEERSLALYGPKAATIAQIWALVKECEEPGWDGSGAEPLSEVAAHNACELIRALPADLPLPEPSPEPDGAIALDWIGSRHRMFSVSLGEGPRLPYAWIDGSAEGYGVVLFSGGFVPEKVIEGATGIVGYGGTRVRPA